MTRTLLVLHVLAAILAVGPVTVAASMFPAVARRAQPERDRRAQLTVLHRICDVYAVVGVAVPIFGFADARAGAVTAPGRVHWNLQPAVGRRYSPDDPATRITVSG